MHTNYIFNENINLKYKDHDIQGMKMDTSMTPLTGAPMTSPKDPRQSYQRVPKSIDHSRSDTRQPGTDSRVQTQTTMPDFRGYRSFPSRFYSFSKNSSQIQATRTKASFHGNIPRGTHEAKGEVFYADPRRTAICDRSESETRSFLSVCDCAGPGSGIRGIRTRHG